MLGKPLEDSKKTTDIILEALKNTGQRGIIDQGWGDLGTRKFLYSFFLRHFITSCSDGSFIALLKKKVTSGVIYSMLFYEISIRVGRRMLSFAFHAVSLHSTYAPCNSIPPPLPPKKRDKMKRKRKI